MIKVSVYKQSNYPVNVKKLREVMTETFERNGMISDSEVSVAIVGEKKMMEFGQKYLKEDSLQARQHPVLSFPDSEIQGFFVFPPDGKIHLGEVVISYPKAVEEARKRGKLVEEVILELAKHGALHLVGIHHD
jgi:probable rRNA maturation factor